MFSTRLLLPIVSTAILCASLPAEEPAAAPVFKPIVEKLDVADGDTVVFLGDSITHQCLYTQYVEDYFYTRYPSMRLHFHNAGVGGDRAREALARFDDDVAAFKPKYVTVLLGMNDGAYRDFDKAIFDAYQRDMNTVLDKIAGIGAIAVPMTPTMHDARAARLGKRAQEPRDTYYNGVLALFGGWLREQAQVRGLGFVDMYGPLNNVTFAQRKKDPNWTMIGDAVHPGNTGQVVMAAAVLEDMVARTPVSAITIQEKDGKLVGNAEKNPVIDLQGGETIHFTHTATALPWVLPPEAAEGFTLSKAGHRFSVEKLTVRSLKPANYEVKIDGQPVGQWTDGQLAVGVEIEANDKTPQYQQALKVALLNKERNEKAYYPLRDQWAALKGRRREIEKLTQANDPELEAKKTEFDAWHKTMMENVEGLRGKAKEFEDRIYATNQPSPHTYEISPVK